MSLLARAASRAPSAAAAARAAFLSTAPAPALTIGLIPGDGIGHEVIPAARRVLEAAVATSGAGAPQLRFVDLDAGFDTFQRTGNSLPDATVRVLRDECQGALFGAVSSPIHKVQGYSSPIVKLRQVLSLYANVRPVTHPAAPTARGTRVPVDLVVVRENTECLYVKQETLDTDPVDGTRVARATRVISERATRRVAKVAFALARARDAARRAKGADAHPRNPLVTVVHKSNVLSVSDGLFREVAREVHTAEGAGIDINDQLIDSMVYRLFREPEVFDVCLAPNLYGDILSDAAAALAGSLGMVPSANVGDTFVMGEPVHGSAPDIAGQGIANPVAAIRSAGLLLEYLGHPLVANRIYAGVERALDQGYATRDLGGSHSTTQVTEAVIDAVRTSGSA